MMKPRALFIQCFVTNRETAPREKAFAHLLRDMGYTVELFTQTRRGRKSSTFDGMPLHQFDVDDKTLARGKQYSSAMGAAAVAYKPDVVFFKNIEMESCRKVMQALPPQTVYGGILGGRMNMRSVMGMDMMFVEYRRQIDQLRAVPKLEGILVELMPKLILWPDIETCGQPERDVDVCVVGSFSTRKNQEALIPLFDDTSISFAGQGGTLPLIAAAAAGRPHIRFLGQLKHQDVFRLMLRSKLLVHPSRWEGVPRVSVEAFACGTPMVAMRSTLGDAYGGQPFVALVDDESEIRDTVLSILRDPPRLAEMSREAKEHALKVHGPNRLSEIAAAVDVFLAERLPWKCRKIAFAEKKRALMAAGAGKGKPAVAARAVAPE